MVKKRTIYTASDGKEFDNEKEAEEHDKKVIRESIKVYKVYYNPDLNEGRGYGDHGYRKRILPRFQTLFIPQTR